MRIDQLPVASEATNLNTVPLNVDGVTEQISVGNLSNAIRDNVYGAPLTASTSAGMTDQTKVYVYTGTTGGGYTNGHWYYYNGSAWTDGGVYNSSAVQTDTTLTLAGVPADAAAAGGDLTDLKSALCVSYENLSFPVEAGTMAIHNNGLYFAKVRIDTQESFTASKWLQAPMSWIVSLNRNYINKRTPVKAIDWLNVNPTIYDGYINANGSITQSTDVVYTDYILLLPKQTLYVEQDGIFTSSKYMAAALYDINKTFINRTVIYSESTTVKYGKFTNTSETKAYYVRLTYRNRTGTYIYNTYVFKDPGDEYYHDLAKKHIDSIYQSQGSQTLIPVTGEYAYINTVNTIGETVSLTPVPFETFCYIITDCSAEDIYTITGKGASGGRLWAFIDSDNKLISCASQNAYEHEMALIAPSGAAKLIVNVDIGFEFCLYKGKPDSRLTLGGLTSLSNNKNYYILTAVAEGETVSFTRRWFYNYENAVVECSAGDVFTIAGEAGDGGRLWAFVNSSNTLLSKAPANLVSPGETVIAPYGAKYLICNSTIGSLVIKKNTETTIGDFVKAAIIQTGQIHDLPKTVVAMPEVEYTDTVQNGNVAAAKPGIFINGENMAITYGENLDGDSVDIPKFSESGCLAMKYKYFKYNSGSVSDVAYGLIAQKGSTYTDYEGNTQTMSGGAGLPSVVNGIQYFTTPYEKSGNNPLDTFSGIQNYGKTPCCCSISVSNSGVTVGEIKELILNYEGIDGKFDLRRIDPNYSASTTFITTTPPFFDGSNYHWLQVVSNGFMYLKSTDGRTWTYQFTVPTPFDPICEVMCVYKSSNLYYFARTNKKNEYSSDTLYIGKINVNNQGITEQYKLPFVEVRPWVALSGDDILLFYTSASKQITECIRIVEYGSRELFFWRWFTIYKDCTWYIAANNEAIRTKNFTKMYLAGGRSESGSGAGMSFLVLNVGTDRPRTPNDIGAMVI